MLLNALIKNSAFYAKLANFHFVSSDKFNKAIGLYAFAWIVKNTFFKFFNQKIKLDKKLTYGELIELRKEMTIAEISHLIGFIFVTYFALQKGVSDSVLFGLTIMLINTLMNFYPSLLQQFNKRRLDRLIKITERRMC